MQRAPIVFDCWSAFRIESMPVQPEHDHLKMLADWYGWIIFILVTIIIAIAKAVGKLSNTTVEPVYATQIAMTSCQTKLMNEFKGMRKEINDKIDNAHTEFREDIRMTNKRIDTLYRKD